MNYDKEPFERTFESLEELADTISEALQCSVTIEDANHKLISYSSHDTETDSARISTIIGRRVPAKIIQTLWRDGVIQRLMNSDEPVRVSAIQEIGLGDRLAIAIRKDNSILGYIWVLEEEKRLDDIAAKQLIKAAKAAKTKLLQLQMKHKREEQDYQNFFWQLLTGHMKSDTEISEQAERLRLSLPPLFRVNVLKFASDFTEKTIQQIKYLITTSLQNHAILHTFNNDLLILLEAITPEKKSNRSADMIAVALEQMKVRFGMEPMARGCGSVYGQYSKAIHSYQEALTVIQIKEKFPEEMNSVHWYADLGFYRLLPAILKEKRDHCYENECLQKLYSYDLEHNGNLLRTLEIYLSNDCRMKETAEFLHIHDNTLNYRLKRISEIGGIDLNNMDQKVTC
ncbi:PucR family transcriptional regulator [Cohnella silvisoli]|uniref:Helix-turn-helix domain-containing protein n=1 Tax=Cohnella silvisoli TaxID=2873699 RepID=A0ABV1KYD3_9BACL|nr:helix-turn-helix domain-containing protein [Cohnella silvisoli]MCD9023795.1 helix-turn-helix domain-containing protein [Cohnella silvisoli]